MRLRDPMQEYEQDEKDRMITLGRSRPCPADTFASVPKVSQQNKKADPLNKRIRLRWFLVEARRIELRSILDHQ